ncbi:MAG TPA: DUF3857 and transglutaminase domain-containing protein [Nevskiaceae bacterium]|nr:DUF3857 and transglutaminase domain-containing protein [Nevskiaceae bacterium]
MFRISCVLATTAILGWGSCSPVLAASNDKGRGYLDVSRLHIDYRVEADGSYVETVDRITRLISEEAVHAEGQLRVPYSASLDQFEVVEARTIKSNGRRIEVPRQSIFVQDGLISPTGLTSFQDIKTTVVVYPELEAGDSVQLRTRVTRKRPMLPGVFDLTQVYPGDVRYDDVAVTLDAPANYPLQIEAVGIQAAEPRTLNGRVLRKWTYRNPEIERTEEGSVHPVMYRPRLLVSSLSSYEALARASEARFAGKANVTPAIRAMAQQITAGATTPRERARRIHEWVARNVRYFAIILDVGGYVPRAADEVLASRFGDCKDHTVLLQALLAAQGIDSVPALLSNQPIFELPKVAVLSSFNHVIPYIPSLDVYLETNARTIPFGVLGYDEVDKPVVLLGSAPRVARTPPATTASNTLELATRIELRSDGSASGSDMVKARGPLQLWYSGINDAVAGMDPVEVGRKFLISRNMPGEGTISAAPAPNNDHFEFNLLYELFDAVDLTQEGGLRVVPPLDTFEPAAKDMLSDTTTRKQPFQCSARTEVQRVTVVFPPGSRLTLPSNVTIPGPNRTYTATYQLVGGSTVQIERRYVASIPHAWCSPDEQASLRTMQSKILRDLRSEIRYSRRG